MIGYIKIESENALEKNRKEGEDMAKLITSLQLFILVPVNFLSAL